MVKMVKKIRINKFLAQCGLGSRRKTEILVNEKKIKVNGKTIIDLATEIDPENDCVKYNNKIINHNIMKYYLIINKPKNCITTVTDPFKRPTVMDFIPEKYINAGVFPVGRLDKDTEGLLLLTNDGELAHKLMHPRYDSKKEYIAVLDRELEEMDKIKIEKGVVFREFRAKPCKLQYMDNYKKRIKIIISEGKKRQIRTTFRKFHYKLKNLKRTALGPLQLGNLGSSACRDLRKFEVNKLKKYTR